MEVDKSCPGCGMTLVVPYIHCVQCRTPAVDLCLHCFAKGLKLGDHESDHRYSVVKFDLPLFDQHWTAAEELKLLDTLAECGVGNWADVAHMVQTKSRSACEAHYNKHYLENPVSELPQMPEAERTLYTAPVPFCPSDDPPRPVEGSTLQTEMSGYMAARGDFAVEYDNYAETNLEDISFTDTACTDPLMTELKLAAVDVYLNVLKERTRRKRIIRQCGLVNVKKTLTYNRSYENTVGYGRLDSLRVFQKLVDQQDWDMFLESWHYEISLKQCISRLQEYRQAGLTTVTAAKMYDHLKRRKLREQSKRHLFSDVLHNLEDKWSCNQWLRKQAAMCKVAKGDLPNPAATGIIRRPTVPLDIVGLPGYDKLNEKEQVVCSSVRLVPESYLEFKSILMAECRKVGYLRLAQARSMIKIDVNKTRKIYDFLVDEGLVNKDSI